MVKPRADLAFHLRLKFCDAVLNGHAAGSAALDQLARRDAEFLGQLFDFDPSFDHRGWSLGAACVLGSHKVSSKPSGYDA